MGGKAAKLRAKNHGTFLIWQVSGHRLGTAEIESALVTNPACVEAAVVGIPHELKGQVPYKEGAI